MKRNFLFFVFTLALCSFTFAQSTKIPQLVNFQAVARDAAGTAKANQDIQVRLTVRDGSPNGSSVYCALYETKTNDFGAFNIQINRNATPCNANSPSFESILWENGSKWIQIEYRFGIGTYTDLGATEIASTFYAFAAQSAEKVGFINTDNAQDGFVLAYDATNKIWKPRQLVLNGISVIQPGTGISVDQTGNTVKVNNTGDTNPSDDITNATQAQGDVSGTFPSLQVDRIKGRAISGTSPTDGQVLKWNATNQTWEPQADEKGSGSSGDNWGTQVIQTTGNSLTGNGTVGSPLALSQQGALTGQVLKWDGSNWAPAQDLSGGSGGQTTVSVDPNGLTISGNPVSGYLISNIGDTNPNDDITQNSNAIGDVTGPFSNLQIAPNTIGNTEIANGSISSEKLASMGANNGQVLKFNGSTWVPSNDLDSDAQTLSLSGNQLTISGSNSSVNLPTGATYFEGQGIDISPNNTISVNPTEVFANGDVTGPLNNLQIQSNTVGSNEIINGSITQADLGFSIQSSQWQNNANKIFYNSGFVGIGSNDPSFPLQVANPTTSTNSAILGIGSTAGAGVAGLGDNFSPVSSDKMGVYGSSQIGILGVGNTITGTNAFGVGLLGIGQGNNGVGVIARAGAGTGSIASFIDGNEINDGSQFFINSNGDSRIVEVIEPTGHGMLTTFGPNGSRNVELRTPANTPNSGSIAVYGPSTSQTTPSAWMFANNTGNGQLDLFASDGDLRARMFATPAGFLSLNGPGASATDNKSNVQLTFLNNFPNNGYVVVNDEFGTNQAGMYVNASGQGQIFADVKNFRMTHPNDDKKEIWYACIEGPEAAAYDRGTAKLIDGTAYVYFSEHFQAVANHKTMTVIITPLSSESKGIAVIEKSATGFKVKELLGGNGSYEFDWEVKCVRKGYEEYKAVRDIKLAPIPASPPSENLPKNTGDTNIPIVKVVNSQQLKTLGKKE